jgi:hypothetical protein
MFSGQGLKWNCGILCGPFTDARAECRLECLSRILKEKEPALDYVVLVAVLNTIPVEEYIHA